MSTIRKILMFSLLILLFSFKHPFYLSVTDLKYNKAEKALQGSVKLFVYDLEDALKRIHNETVDLVHVTDSVKTIKRLKEYLNTRLAFKINGKPKNYDFIGFEREEEAIWVYIEITKCPEPKKLNIKNSLLYDYIKDQMNIIHVEFMNEKKSLKLNNPDNLAVFEFD